MPDPTPSATSPWARLVCGAAAAALVAGAFVAWALLDPASLHETSREDGPIEWATALAFLAAAAGFGAAARRIRRSESASRASGALLIAASIASMVFCAEELSWGQRLIGFPTPPIVRSLNQQGEFNVHNLGDLQWLKYSLLVALVAAVGLGLPMLRLVPSLRLLAARIGLPLPAAIHVGMFAAALFFLRHAANRIAMVHRNDAQEVGELLFAVAIAWVGLHAAARPHAVGLAPEPRPELSLPPSLAPPLRPAARAPAEAAPAAPVASISERFGDKSAD
jgi:hypothetical protein